MVVKVLAWIALLLSLVFVGLASAGVFAWDSLGAETAKMLFFWGAIPSLGLALFLAFLLLVVSAFQSKN